MKHTISLMVAALLAVIASAQLPARAETCWQATGNWQNASPISCALPDSSAMTSASRIAASGTEWVNPEDADDEPASVY